MERDQLLPVEPDHGGHPHGHPQLRLFLYLHERQVRDQVVLISTLFGTLEMSLGHNQYTQTS